MTLTLTRWPSYTNLTRRPWRYAACAIWTSYVKAFGSYRLTDIHTHRHDQNYIPPHFADGQWSENLRSRITCFRSCRSPSKHKNLPPSNWDFYLVNFSLLQQKNWIVSDSRRWSPEARSVTLLGPISQTQWKGRQTDCYKDWRRSLVYTIDMLNSCWLTDVHISLDSEFWENCVQ